MSLYDQIGKGYDTTRRADPFITGRLWALLDVDAGASILDVACGTGNYTAALRQRGGTVTGVDIASTMLNAARTKDTGGPWVQGDALRLPLRAGMFDGAVCTLAIHHFPAIEPAFAEVFRVLRRGRFVLFTSDHPQIHGVWLCEYFPDIIARSITQMPDLDHVRAALTAAGFTTITTEPYEIRDGLQDFFFYSGKHRPEMYLDPRVRAGTSVFAMADPAEVAAGVAHLEQDIASGRIAEVQRAYAHTHGDYLFVVATKDDSGAATNGRTATHVL